MKRRIEDTLGRRDVAWAKTLTPTLAAESMWLLEDLVNPTFRRELLEQQTTESDLELAPGRFVLSFGNRAPTIEDLAGWHREVAMPAGNKAATRKDQDNYWRSYVTFMLGMGKLDRAWPVERIMLSAFVTNLVAFGYTGASIACIISAVNTRNESFNMPPILAYKEMTRWLKPLKKYIKRPTQQKFPLRPVHIRLFAQIYDKSVRHLHNLTLTVMGMIGAMRPNELGKLDVCDWRVGWEVGDDGRSLGAELNIASQKNSDIPQTKRFAYGANTAECLIGMVAAWKERTGLHVHPSCIKWTNMETRGARCEWCGGLFRKFCGDFPQMRGTSNAHALTERAVTVAVEQLLTAVGQDATTFSGKCLRRGGLSTAKMAGIPEDLRRLQSGHKSKANRIYEDSSMEEDGEEAHVVMQKPASGWGVEDRYMFSKAFHGVGAKGRE